MAVKKTNPNEPNFLGTRPSRSHFQECGRVRDIVYVPVVGEPGEGGGLICGFYIARKDHVQVVKGVE